ncbi:unnamed protein product, partial [Didymodactylos carnosus]
MAIRLWLTSDFHARSFWGTSAQVRPVLHELKAGK